MIDYNLAAKTYDNTRKYSNNIIMLMHEKIKFGSTTNILDFGCGTGSYLNDIQNIFSSNCYGVDPSMEMRNIAIKKNQHIFIKEGNHEHIPFNDNIFEFIFMTNVIHHVPDLTEKIDENKLTNGNFYIGSEYNESKDLFHYRGVYDSYEKAKKELGERSQILNSELG